MFRPESGVPIPSRPLDTRDYPLEEMQPGDSFFVPGRSSTSGHPAVMLAYKYARQTGKAFLVRGVKGGVRIWRVGDGENPAALDLPRYGIEKDVPLVSKRSYAARYPFHNMQPGDSFLVPEGERLSQRAASAINSAKRFGQRRGMEFARRTVEGGVRIWRTA